MCRMITSMHPSPFLPVCACGGLPQPRSSRAHAAATRAAALVPSLGMPANTLIAIFVRDRAKERVSVGAGPKLRCRPPRIGREQIHQRKKVFSRDAQTRTALHKCGSLLEARPHVEACSKLM